MTPEDLRPSPCEYPGDYERDYPGVKNPGWESVFVSGDTQEHHDEAIRTLKADRYQVWINGTTGNSRAAYLYRAVL